ncbi:MAG: hypothetical protein HXX81_01020 [Campylobacterales bacterium]|nr:hypothetical protein [Campylobacterales bacterium]
MFNSFKIVVLSIVVCGLIFQFLLYYILKYDNQKVINVLEINQKEKFVQAYNAVFEHYEQLSKVLFIEVVNNKDILSIIHEALNGDEQAKNIQREKLFKLYRR